MNKKVLTLCVSALLASTVMASAAVDKTDFVPVKFTENVFIGDAVTKLPENTDGSLYHLKATGYETGAGFTEFANTTNVLSLDENGTIQLVDLSKTDYDKIDDDNNWTSSLWCVNVTRTEANGQNPIFDFINDLRGMTLSVSAEGYKDWGTTEKTTDNNANVYYQQQAAISDGEVSGWKFYPVYDDMKDDWFLGSYVEGSVMAVLAWDTNSSSVVVKVVDNATYADKVSGLLKFTLNKAVDKVLTANQFNTVLGTQDGKDGVQLTFTPDANHPDYPNLFAQTKIKAEARAAANNSESSMFVYLYKIADYKEDTADGANRYYLHVDTAYTNNTATQFLQFAYMDKTGEKFGAENKPVNMSELDELGQFAIYYNATEKRIYLRARSTYNKPENVKYWSELTSDNLTSIDWTTSSVNPSSDDCLKNWVDLQELASSDDLRIITIKTDELSGIHTKVDFGFGSCNVNPTDRTSKDNGLYIITNEEGKVLAAPISKNGADANVAE